MAIPDWLSISQLSGSGDTIITVTASTYEQLNQVRNGLLRVSGVTKYVDVTAYQTGHTFSVSNTSFSFPAAGGSSAFTITTDGNWSISPASVSHFSFSPSSGTGTTTVTLSCSSNSSNSGISASATVVGRGTSGLTMTQAERASISVSPSATSIGTAGGTITVTVTSTANWTLSEGYAWLTPSVVSGTSGVSTVTLTVDSNLADRVRRGVVTFACVDDPSITASVSITQGSHAYDSTTPLTFEILSDGVIMWTLSNDQAEEFPIEYNHNGDGWQTIYPVEGGSSISVNSGDYVQFRGNNARYAHLSWANRFCSFSGSTADFSAYGNIMSLINSTSFSALTTFTSSNSHAFCYLFYGTNIIDAVDLILPSTTMVNRCYGGMFGNCYDLVTPPELPATTLAMDCYMGMFFNCTSLAYAPQLPANTMQYGCYYDMFEGCTSLTQAPELPAMSLAEYCYTNMFRGCTGITETGLPELPATTLTTSCYVNMFYGCSGLTNLSSYRLPASTMATYCYSGMFCECRNLVTPPVLSATTLAYGCYSSMFSMCTSLATAPALPASTMAERCYAWMFQSCESLHSGPVLSATTLATGCYYEMFWNATGLTSAPALPATSLETECYYRMFGGCTSLTTAPDLNAPTLVTKCYALMFQNCTRLNAVKCTASDHSASNCTYEWLTGVASNGTFTKKATTSWSSGTSGIPSNWSIVDVA